MAHCYLSDNYPGHIMMANRDPGPGWRLAEEARPKQGPVLKVDTAQLAEAMSAALDHSAELRRDLADSLTPSRQATTANSFTDAVKALVASEKLSYGDACRRVAMQQPELYRQHRLRAMLSDEPRGMML